MGGGKQRKSVHLQIIEKVYRVIIFDIWLGLVEYDIEKFPRFFPKKLGPWMHTKFKGQQNRDVQRSNVDVAVVDNLPAGNVVNNVHELNVDIAQELEEEAEDQEDDIEDDDNDYRDM